MKQGTPGFVGEKLREAREARGLTAISLADLLGVTRSAISQYELGLQTPRPEILERASKVLNLPVTFFREPSQVKPFRFESLFCRAFGPGTKIARTKAERRLEWARSIVEFAKQYVEFPPFNLQDRACNPNSISKEDIERIAIDVRTQWGLRDLPIGNLLRRAEDNGIVVLIDDMGFEALDSVCAWDSESSQPYIGLAAHVAACAPARYELARTIGHLVLHRNTPRARLAMNNDFAPMKEQASRFARAFLLPESTFASELYSMSLDAMRLSKQKWKAPISIMVKRLEDLRIISEDQAKKLWIGISRRGWRVTEPLDDELPLERPRLLSESIGLLIDEQVLSKQDVLDALPYSDRDIEVLAHLPQGYLTDTMPVITLLPEHQRHSPRAKDDTVRGQVLSFPNKNVGPDPDKKRKVR
jgi:Zn-dependent peptidase ImmA (M78 family)/DNA-binding XRE family transcriptional regulator